MNIENEVKKILSNKFEAKRVKSIINHFLSSVRKLEETDWENSLIKAGKFVEATIKLLWVYCEKTLPIRSKDFKASVYAEKIIREVKITDVPEDAIRLQIPRACIFIYDITSNRGARHDSEEVDPNEMDANVIAPMCSWILAELIRFSAKQVISISDAKKIVESLMERRYPVFEEIEGRVYVDRKIFKSAPECVLLLLYKSYPRRINKGKLVDLLKRHNFKHTDLRLQRLMPYIDINKNGEILLRATGRKRVEDILNKQKD
jgi:hypothetical protein